MSLVNDLTQFKITHKMDGMDLRTPREIPEGESEDRSSTLDSWPNIHQDSSKNFLMQKALQKNQAELGPHGELLVATGAHTGRAADDKYIVHTEETEKKIWWENNIKPMGEEAFETLYDEVTAYLYRQAELFSTRRSIGNAKHFALNIDFLSEMPSAALFTEYMFKGPQDEAQGTYQILHAPFFELCPFKYGT